LILILFVNLSCHIYVYSSPVAQDEIRAEMPKPTPTPEKLEEIYLDGDDQATLLEYQDYKLEKVTVRKMDEKIDTTLADISDAVLTKNGKRIARFKGDYHPLGNQMSFGLFSFLGKNEKQIWITDETGQHDARNWIVSLTPKFKVVFDSRDYGLGWKMTGLVDVEKDGVVEVKVGGYTDLDIGMARVFEPWAETVFKYDSNTRKYLPASHILTEYTLNGINEQIDKYKEPGDKPLKDLLEIMLKYIYAGKDAEAWKFFDENFTPTNNIGGFANDKEESRKRIKNALNKDPVYKFIKSHPPK
jgi:hypothetical protein